MEYYRINEKGEVTKCELGEAMEQDGYLRIIRRTWFSKFFSNSKHKIALSDAWVSTVFLTLNHSFDGKGLLLFETMIFPRGTMFERDSYRYESFEEALRNHLAIERRALPIKPIMVLDREYFLEHKSDAFDMKPGEFDD